MSTTSGNSTLYSRFLFVFVLVCAAVMSFITCSDAARASPVITQVDNGVKHNILRSLYTPYKQNPPLFTALLSKETGVQPGTDRETETSGMYSKTSLISHHQPGPLPFTDGAFIYDENSPDNRQPGVQRGHSTGALRPGSRIFTIYSQHGEQSFEKPQSRVNYYPLSQKAAQSTKSYKPVIIRKSFKKQLPFHQGSTFSQVWAPKNPQKSHNKEITSKNDSPNVAEDKSVWQTSTVFSPQGGGHWSSPLPSSIWHYGGYKEANKLAAVGVQSTSSRIQPSKFLGFAPHEPSISYSLDASSSEKVTDFSQRPNSVSSSETGHTKVQSYLFKDSQNQFFGHKTIKRLTGDGPSTFPTPQHEPVQASSEFSLNLKQLQQLHRKDPTKEVQPVPINARPLYYNNVAWFGAQADSFTKYQPTFSVYPTTQTPSQLSLHLAPGKGNTLESFASMPHVDSKYNHATNTEKSDVGKSVNTSTKGSMHGYKSGQSTKITDGFRGFESPTWQAAKEQSVLSSYDGFISRSYSFDKRNSLYTPLSPKYSFGQRGPPTVTTAPEKHQRTPTVYSSPSPGISNIIQTTTLSTSRLFKSGFKEVASLLHGSDANIDSNSKRRQFRIYKRISGLKEYGSRPQGGAKTLVKEPDTSATLKDFKGFKLMSSHIWQPKSSRVHKWHNQTGQREQGTSDMSTQNQTKLKSEELQPVLKAAGSNEVSRLTADKYKQNSKINSFVGFLPLKDRAGNGNNEAHRKHTEQNPSTASPTHKVSSADLRSAGGGRKNKPAAMKASLFNSPTSSMVRGTRVKGKRTKGRKLSRPLSQTREMVNAAIVRLPKIRIKAFTNAEIVGSASFRGIRATAWTPTTPADKDDSPNATATIKKNEQLTCWASATDADVHRGENTGRSPEAVCGDKAEDVSSVEEKKSKDVHSGMKIFDTFLDVYGNESETFTRPDVLLTDTTKSQALKEIF